MPSTHNISQNKITKAIIAYLEIVGNPLSPERKSSLEKGLCFGFSVVHAYMAAKGRSVWWKNVLEMISQWDTERNSLDSLPSNVPEAFSLKKCYGGQERGITYRNLIDLVTNYVLYNQGTEATSEVSGIEQHTFLKPNGLFCSEEGGIQSYLCYIGCFDKVKLQSLLRKIKDSSPFEGMITISNSDHRCSFRYDTEFKHWCFYDPNYPDGEHSFDAKDDLISEINEKLGKNLVVTLSGFKTMPNALSYHYTEFYADTVGGLYDQTALYEIAQYAPDQLTGVMALAERHKNIREAVAAALKTPTQEGRTALHMIAQCAPDKLAAVMTLAERDENIRKAVAAALKTPHQEGWTALHVIARCAPDQLAAVMALAKDQNIREAVATALKTQNQEGWTALHVIARYAPDQLAAVMTLAKDHQNIRKAVAAALKTQNEAGWTVLHMISHYCAKQLTLFYSLAKYPCVANALLNTFNLRINRYNGYNGRPLALDAPSTTLEFTDYYTRKMYRPPVSLSPLSFFSAKCGNGAVTIFSLPIWIVFAYRSLLTKHSTGSTNDATSARLSRISDDFFLGLTIWAKRLPANPHNASLQSGLVKVTPMSSATTQARSYLGCPKPL